MAGNVIFERVLLRIITSYSDSGKKIYYNEQRSIRNSIFFTSICDSARKEIPNDEEEHFGENAFQVWYFYCMNSDYIFKNLFPVHSLSTIRKSCCFVDII